MTNRRFPLLLTELPYLNQSRTPVVATATPPAHCEPPLFCKSLSSAATQC